MKEYILDVEFGRIITAMVTPFTSDDRVDLDESVRLANYLVDHGTTTVLLTGTTGESPTLTHEEEYQLWETVSKAIKGRAKIMAGTGSNSTKTAIESTRKAKEFGIDSILQVVPYYNKPSQEGLFQHFSAIAHSTDLPIMLYNIPGRSGVNMEPKTVARLADIPNIVALKEAAGSVDQAAAMIKSTPDDFLVYSGDDGLTLEFMKKGAYGVVSVASHCAGDLIQSMIQSYVDGNAEKAESLNSLLKPLFEVLFITSNPSPVKAALREIGFNVGVPRLPLIDVTEDERLKINSVLHSLKLIP